MEFTWAELSFELLYSSRLVASPFFQRDSTIIQLSEPPLLDMSTLPIKMRLPPSQCTQSESQAARPGRRRVAKSKTPIVGQGEHFGSRAPLAVYDVSHQACRANR